MDAIREWVREIVVLVVFVTFLELLLPRSSLRNWVRVVIGLMMLVAILKPVLTWNGAFPSQDTERVQCLGKRGVMEEVMTFRRTFYARAIAKQIGAYLAEQGYGNCEVRVVWQDAKETAEVERIEISHVKHSADAVQDAVCRRFGLTSQQVRVK